MTKTKSANSYDISLDMDLIFTSKNEMNNKLKCVQTQKLCNSLYHLKFLNLNLNEVVVE